MNGPQLRDLADRLTDLLRAALEDLGAAESDVYGQETPYLPADQRAVWRTWVTYYTGLLQDVAYLMVIGGGTGAEAAAVLEVSPQAVSERAKRARFRLAEFEADPHPS